MWRVLFQVFASLIQRARDAFLLRFGAKKREAHSLLLCAVRHPGPKVELLCCFWICTPNDGVALERTGCEHVTAAQTHLGSLRVEEPPINRFKNLYRQSQRIAENPALLGKA